MYYFNKKVRYTVQDVTILPNHQSRCFTRDTYSSNLYILYTVGTDSWTDMCDEYTKCSWNIPIHQKLLLVYN
jgi:hypothetical protein